MRAALIFCAVLMPLALAPCARAQQPLRPERVLSQKFGLSRLPSSNIWAVKREVELRRYWAELPELRSTIASIEQELTEAAQRNAREWASADRNEASLRAALSAIEPNDANRARLEGQLAVLRRGLFPPDRFSESADVRRQLILLSERRYALWHSAQKIRLETPLVADDYAQLAEHAELHAALRQLKHRLGPARDYAADAQKIDEYERPVLTDWIPLYLEGSRPRCTALVNETPITFTWTGSPEPAYLTAAMADASGLKLPADAAETTITLERRTFRARRGTIPYLRLGKHELREVPILVLPPEAEFAGARLSPEALSGLRAVAEPQRMRLVLQAADP